MATANLEPAEYECPVCNDFFKHPKLLMCGHDLCQDCLVSLCNSSDSALCPLCRCLVESFDRNTNDPVDDIINNLPDDLAMAAVVECARTLRGKQECYIHSGVTAVFFCLQCNEMFCSTCSDLHRKQKATRHHVVDDLSSLTPIQLAANRQVTCTIHSDRTAELFCSDHRVPLCNVCAIADHRDCREVSHLEKKGKAVRYELDQLLTTLNNAERMLTIAISELKDHVTEIDQNTESVIQEMEETYKKCSRLAESCLERHKKCVRDSNSEKKTRIHGIQETLTNLHGIVISHKVVVKRVQQMVFGSEVFDMTATLTKRLYELELDTFLPSDLLSVEILTTPTLDRSAMTRFEHDLSHLTFTTLQAKPVLISETDPFLREFLLKTFLKIRNQPYFVPPVIINSLSEDDATTHMQKPLVPNPTQVSKVGSSELVKRTSSQANVGRVQEGCLQNDMIQQNVLFCLWELAREQKEAMCVLSQLKFSDYPGKHCYLATAKHFDIPVPDDLDQIHNDGDFDILIIHRCFGLIVGEIRSVPSQTQVVKKSQEQVDQDIALTIEKSIDQLNKSEIVLRHLTKDLEPKLSVRKTLILPHVTRTALTRVLSSNCKLEQVLGQCLMATDVTQILDLCLLSDNLTDHSSPWSIRQLQTWWSSRVSVFRDTFMTLEIYLSLVARFIGLPASVCIYSITTPGVQARNEGEDMSVGKIMTKLPLTYSQVDLLTRNPPRVLLTGGPGVGKSVMLALKGKQWLRAGQRVHIVSTGIPSLAVSYMLKHVIQETARLDGITNLADDTVQLHSYDFENKETDVDNAISTLTLAADIQMVNVICDEFWGYDSQTVGHLQRFVTGLCTQLPNVCLWAASRRHDQKPAELQEVPLTFPLRFPAAVLSEVEKAVNFYHDMVYPYTTTTLVNSYSDPNIIHVNHQDSGHTGSWPLECYKCGQNIADILQRLGVGEAGPDASHSTSNTILTPTTLDIRTRGTNNSETSLTPLQYRDVFVLARSLDLRDDVKDDAGNVMASANGVVRGLRDAGIPVRVIRKGHMSSHVCDTAIAQSDIVTLACPGDVLGLERKVVVWLPHKSAADDDDNLRDESYEAFDIYYIVSLCTSQLVVVDVPLFD